MIGSQANNEIAVINIKKYPKKKTFVLFIHSKHTLFLKDPVQNLYGNTFDGVEYKPDK